MANSLAFYGLGITFYAVLLSTQVFAHEQSQAFHSLNSEEVDRHGYKQAEGYHYSNGVGPIGAGMRTRPHGVTEETLQADNAEVDHSSVSNLQDSNFGWTNPQNGHTTMSRTVGRRHYYPHSGYNPSNLEDIENVEEDQTYHFGRRPNLWHAKNSWAFPAGKTTARMRQGGKVAHDYPGDNSPRDKCAWKLVCKL